jgi:hypothetical protein
MDKHGASQSERLEAVLPGVSGRWLGRAYVRRCGPRPGLPFSMALIEQCSYTLHVANGWLLRSTGHGIASADT